MRAMMFFADAGCERGRRRSFHHTRRQFAEKEGIRQWSVVICQLSVDLCHSTTDQ
jgi:hypothetical protein